MSSVVNLIGCQVLLLTFFTYSTADYADVHLCNSTSLQVKAGDTMQICCELGENDCLHSSPSDMISIRKSEISSLEEPVHNLTRTSQCSVMLSIVNASEEDSGLYMCFWNNAKNAQSIQRFFVIKKPLAPTILSVTVLPLRSSYKMVVRFAIAELHDIASEYEVWMDRGPSNYGLPRQVLLCANATCAASTFLCHCEYESEVSYQVGDWTYTLEVRVIRGIQRVYSNTTIVFVKHFQPGVVRNVNVIHASFESAVVKFCMPAGFQRLVEFMYLHSVPLMFRLNLWKLQGKRQKIMVTVPSPTMTDSPMCVEVTFADLTPFTNYKIVIVAEGPGGNSSERSFFFSTHTAAPKRAPKMQPYDFAHGMDENGVTAVYVQWERLDADSRGGNVEYVVQAMSSREEKLAESITDQNTIVFYNLTSDLSSTRVWALNEKGYSDDYAEIIIKPSVPVYQQPQMQVELRRDVARVVLNNKRIKGEELVLRWCPGHRLYPFGLDICEEYPQSQFQSGPAEEVNLELSRHNVDDLEESNTTLVNISYVYARNKSNKRRSEPVNVTAEIFTGLYALLSPKVTANFSTPGDDDDADSVTSSGDGLMESVDDESWTISGLGSMGKKLRILISVKRDKHWTGLFPAECYFDGEGDMVKLILSADYKEDGTVKLGIKQDCKPQYFLANSFRVYTTDGDCFPQPDKSEVQTVLNQYFERSFLLFAKMGSAVCVIAQGLEGKQSAPEIKFWDDIIKKNSVDEIPWKIVAPCIIAIIIFIALVSYVCIRVRRSKNYVKSLATSAELLVVKDRDCKDTVPLKMKESNTSLVNGYEQVGRFQKEVTELSDSGLGSMPFKRLSSVYDQEPPGSLESVTEKDEEAEGRHHESVEADVESCENALDESSDIGQLGPSQKDLIENAGFEFKPTLEESNDESIISTEIGASPRLNPEDSEGNVHIESKFLVEEKIDTVEQLLSDGTDRDVGKMCLDEPSIGERESSNLTVGMDNDVSVPGENSSPVAFVESEKEREQELKEVDKGVLCESSCDSGQGIETSSSEVDQMKLVHESGFSFVPSGVPVMVSESVV